MNPDPLRALRNRLRQHRLTLIAEVCRYTGVETPQHVRELLSGRETRLVNAKPRLETDRGPAETAKNNREVDG